MTRTPNFFRFLFNWVEYVLKSFFFMISDDFLYFLKSTRYLYSSFFNTKRLFLKDWLLWFYFVFPMYLLMRVLIVWYVLMVKYFVFFLTSMLVLINFFFDIKVPNFFYSWLKNSTLLKEKFRDFFSAGLSYSLLNIIKVVLLYTISNFVYELLPSILSPLITLFVYFRSKYRVLRELFTVKVSEPVGDVVDILIKKINFNVTYFYNYWLFEVTRLLLLSPPHILQTFLPIFINHVFFIFLLIVLNFIYFLVYWTSVITFSVIHFFIYLVNVLLYVPYYVIYCVSHSLRWYVHNLILLLHLILVRSPRIFILYTKSVLNFLTILYFDITTFFTIFKNKVTR